MAAPVIGGIYDDFDDNRHEQLLLHDSGSIAGILYFTGDEVYKEYCSEMNAWVSPVATRNEYIQAKGMLESFTADLPNITLVLNFLVNNYSNRIDELLVNYECILYDTKSAKFDFAFYYMVECFLRTVEENAVAAFVPPPVAAAAAIVPPPVGAAAAAAFVPPLAAAAAAAGGSATPPTGPRNPHGSPASTQAYSVTKYDGGYTSGGSGPGSPIQGSLLRAFAASAASAARAARAAGGEAAESIEEASAKRVRLSTHTERNEGSDPAAPPSSPQLDPKQPNLLAPQIKILTRYLHDLYKGPEELIFDEEITQFHIALLIKYMN